jgi:hypothetical protein
MTSNNWSPRCCVTKAVKRPTGSNEPEARPERSVCWGALPSPDCTTTDDDSATTQYPATGGYPDYVRSTRTLLRPCEQMSKHV